MDERIEDATPETAAITGGVPPAAEPPPQTRGRASSAAASSWLYLVLGVLLLIAAVAADLESGPAIGTAIAGAALIATGVMGLSGFAGPVMTALLGFVAGVLLTLAAFSADDFGFLQLLLLVAGAATFISSFASLAAARRPGRGGEEPRPGVEQV
jgi:hypothetical protein